MSAKTRTLTKLLSSGTTHSHRKSKNITRSAVTNTSSIASAAKDTLKNYIRVASAADSSSSSYLKPPRSNKSPSSKPLSELAVESNRVGTSSSTSDSKRDLSRQLHSIIFDESPDSKETCDYDVQPSAGLLDIPWAPTLINSTTSLRRKDVTRERKQKWVFKSTQGTRFSRLTRLCTRRLGADNAIKVFGKLGRQTGVKEFNAMIEVCIEKARNTDDEDTALEEFHRAYMVFESMRESGFEIGEETYGPFLLFIIDMGMVEEFHFFCENIKKENLNSLSRLAYYEMLLWIKLNDGDKIQMLITNADGSDESNFNESYLVALCEGDRQEEVSFLLETIDIKKVSSKESMERIFKSLGGLSLETHAKKFLLELKTDGETGQDLSNLIYCYAMSIPNIQIENIVTKFKSLQAELKVSSSSVPYEKLIKTCCSSGEVHLAIDLVESMFEEGLNVRINTINSILTTCDLSCEYNLVHRINSMINDHNIHPNAETFRIMISLCVKMKDFDKAYSIIGDLERLNLIPTANMYNAIMGGYFRQKNFHKGLMVLKQMDKSKVKPDSLTFSYILGNCNSEDDIIKYIKELEESGVQPTKHIFMALINAYAACGLFDKAKQVLSDKRIAFQVVNEMKSVLVSALATNGQMADALEVYDQLKQVEAILEPKSAICLIEHLQSEGELDRLLQLLKQLEDSELWHDGCARIILYCVRYKLLGPAVDLLKQRMEKSSTNEMASEVLFDEVFYEIAVMKPSDVQFGLDLLKGIKEEIGIRASRKSLDFLLSACVNAKDLNRSFSVWKEYQTAGLPYNVLTYLRMYQALLASGGHKAAKVLLGNISDDDSHVCDVIKACQATYGISSSSSSALVEKKKKKKNKKKSK
ncbi:pentatricopeptide repeat-containing protein At4g04790, mitochondrial isoform X1 [Lactuca sativa]|uniref:pentatricopeptide repeat-containing protein At4g04790, mitochondrial isoform X1 n=1 Tax=Lactuca sativa TaxID=4236 RepID=UPI0022AE5D02|nr:pentatricopeptide repeat-containing protein At4g04790, mitochondrial isoform X1 [Lactuca sativa]